MIPYLRERFADLAPYHSPYMTEGVILNANESPYSVPEELVQYMQSRINHPLTIVTIIMEW